MDIISQAKKANKQMLGVSGLISLSTELLKLFLDLYCFKLQSWTHRNQCLSMQNYLLYLENVENVQQKCTKAGGVEDGRQQESDRKFQHTET